MQTMYEIVHILDPTSTLTNWVSQTPPVHLNSGVVITHSADLQCLFSMHAWYTKVSSKNYKLLICDTCNMHTRIPFYNWIPYTLLKIRPVLCVQNSSCRKSNHTRTYGPDLLGVYDIQEPIYNYLEDNILQIDIPNNYGKHHTFRPKTPIYNEVSAHASTNDSIQTNTETLIDP